MGDKVLSSEKEVSRMFIGQTGDMSADEELALHIIHRFNICRDTMETMPALETHLEPLFRSKEKEK
jgi:hypothetical protein